MVGQVVQQGALIAKVYDLDKLTVEIPTPEKEIADIHVGSRGRLQGQGLPQPDVPRHRHVDRHHG